MNAEPRAVTDAREVLAASKAATPDSDVDLARWWGRVEGALELLLAAIDQDDEGQGDEEPLAGDQGDGEECGEPDRAPLIVAAPTEPPAGNVEGAPVYPAPGSAIPGMPGYVVGTCEHRVAGSEWRAGFRTCERCNFGGQPGGEQGDDEECGAEFIDGVWTYAECGCVECRTRLAEDEEADL